MNFWDTLLHCFIGLFDNGDHKMLSCEYNTVWYYCKCGYNKPKRIKVEK
jgi:hypothetical protein